MDLKTKLEEIRKQKTQLESVYNRLLGKEELLIEQIKEEGNSGANQSTETN